jgi:ABC-type iron transport system FetAB ATPase subunit
MAVPDSVKEGPIEDVDELREALKPLSKEELEEIIVHVFRELDEACVGKSHTSIIQTHMLTVPCSYKGE